LADIGKLTVLQFRDPVDRTLSAYEFAVEVSARNLKRPANQPKRANMVATDEVWPWSHFVPWMTTDLRKRVRCP
jgi:hypothetical protein